MKSEVSFSRMGGGEDKCTCFHKNAMVPESLFWGLSGLGVRCGFMMINSLPCRTAVEWSFQVALYPQGLGNRKQA